MAQPLGTHRGTAGADLTSRSLALLLGVALSAALAVSCTSNNDDGSTTSTQQPTTEQAGQPANETTTQPVAGSGDALGANLIYFNDFSDPDDRNRIDSFVAYRDPVVVRHMTGESDHAALDGVDCSSPDTTRTQTRDRPQGHVYLCFPGGDPERGHMMGYAMDTSGYGFVGGLPDQVFEGVSEVVVDINTTSAGARNFVEIKVLPAADTYVNAMPCGPDLPCNGGWDYDDIGGIGASTNSQKGAGLTINTPARPDGFHFDHTTATAGPDGEVSYEQCDENAEHCFRAYAHGETTSIRDRYQHTFRDNQDGTVSFGIADANKTSWVTAPGSFPEGPVRVVIAFHNYTGTKSGDGPGFADNVSASAGGFTWHWDNLAVVAQTATPAIEFFEGESADRIVTPDGCVAFAQGQRNMPHHRDIGPQFNC